MRVLAWVHSLNVVLVRATQLGYVPWKYLSKLFGFASPSELTMPALLLELRRAQHLSSEGTSGGDPVGDSSAGGAADRTRQPSSTLQRLHRGLTRYGCMRMCGGRGCREHAAPLMVRHLRGSANTSDRVAALVDAARCASAVLDNVGSGSGSGSGSGNGNDSGGGGVGSFCAFVACTIASEHDPVAWVVDVLPAVAAQPADTSAAAADGTAHTPGVADTVVPWLMTALSIAVDRRTLPAAQLAPHEGPVRRLMEQPWLLAEHKAALASVVHEVRRHCVCRAVWTGGALTRWCVDVRVAPTDNADGGPSVGLWGAAVHHG